MNKLVIFTLGAAIGSVITWSVLKTKYEQLAQEEIDSVKETFSKRAKYNDILEQEGYNRSSETEETKPVKVEEKEVDGPYVIPPEEFGELDGYSTVSLTYYSNGTLTDDTDEPIDDIDEIVGLDSLDTFGEYEDDSVFVRNDSLKTDYEILYDQRSYLEVVNKSPQSTEE